MSPFIIFQNKIKVITNIYNTIDFHEANRKFKCFFVSVDPSLYQLFKDKGTPQSVNNLWTVIWQGPIYHSLIASLLTKYKKVHLLSAFFDSLSTFTFMYTLLTSYLRLTYVLLTSYLRLLHFLRGFTFLHAFYVTP